MRTLFIFGLLSMSDAHLRSSTSRRLGLFDSITTFFNPVITSENVGPPPVDQCNATDSTLWAGADHGEAKFADHLRDFSMGCLVSLDGAKCVSDKFKDDLGYTPPCSQCMGALAQCTTVFSMPFASRRVPTVPVD